MVLCIETSTDICSVALVDQGLIIACKESEKDFSHSKLLTRYIEDVMRSAPNGMASLRAVALSAGPGSYTALRIGTSVAKGICYAHKIPLIDINSLDVLAAGLYDTGVAKEGSVILPVIDARRKEVYMKVFDAQLHEIESTSSRVLDGDSFLYLSMCSTIHVVGDAVSKMKDILTIGNCVYSTLQPSARYMVNMVEDRLRHNQVADVVYFEPFYFKSPNITLSKKKLL